MQCLCFSLQVGSYSSGQKKVPVSVACNAFSFLFRWRSVSVWSILFPFGAFRLPFPLPFRFRTLKGGSQVERD